MTDITNIETAWRLLRRSEQMAARQKDPGARTKSLKETIAEEDEILLSAEARAAQSTPAASKTDDETHIRLSELSERLKNVQQQQPAAGDATIREQTLAVQYTSTEVTVEYRVLPRVDGLVRRDRNLAETDRYAFDFQDGATFKITDKWSGKSTTIWGDPHVDTSDEEGNFNGEFSDLKSSETHTTLALEDGSRVTFTAHDRGIIEAVDITHAGQHLRGIGAASKDWSDENGLFSSPVDGGGAGLPSGDVVRAGGDGNDWFDTSGRMVWGRTTGPRVTARPYAALEINVRQVEQTAFIQQVDIQA